MACCDFSDWKTHCVVVLVVDIIYNQNSGIKAQFISFGFRDLVVMKKKGFNCTFNLSKDDDSSFGNIHMEIER